MSASPVRGPAEAALRRLRWLALGLGGALLLWLPVEDQTIYGVVIFSAAILTLAVARLLYRLQPASRVLMFSLAGGLGGAAVTPLALLLMAFKTGLHGHSAPDFTPAQISQVIGATPIWSAAGLLIGAGAALLHKYLRS